MPCWPDIWSAIWEFRWRAFVYFPVILAGLAIWAPRLRRRWLRYTVRALGICMAIPAVSLALMALVFETTALPPQYKTAASPNGVYQARLEYDAGFLGRDYSEVTVSKYGCCRHLPALNLQGPSSMDSIQMKWPDDHHLRIFYVYMGSGYGSATCHPNVDGVKVTCIPLPPNTNGAAEAAPSH